MIIFILIIIILYFVLSNGFWALQPVFHKYNLYYWFRAPGIIRNDIINNEYIDHNNIRCYDIKKIDKKILNKCVNLVDRHYLRHDEIHYTPKINNILPYFQMKGETLISIFYNIDKIVGLITGRPLNVNIDNTNFKSYYIDYLCVHKKYRKKGIAPKLIQTHEQIQRACDKSINTCIFKREGILNNIIVPLVQYYTFTYKISDIIENTIKTNNICKINNYNECKLFIDKYSQKFGCSIFSPNIQLIRHNSPLSCEVKKYRLISFGAAIG